MTSIVDFLFLSSLIWPLMRMVSWRKIYNAFGVEYEVVSNEEGGA
jgi:hypothetical protein